MAIYKAIGIMSGTSLDGVDLASVEFEELDGKWTFTLSANESVPYPKKWQTKLSELTTASALDFVKTHVAYGKYTGSLIHNFIKKYDLSPDIIGVHGHTIFHQPKEGYTSQIGDGAAIAAITGQLIACDLRSMDIARGGQGAPLVPIGDQLLFNDYDARLNIGGFANISFQNGREMVAYDIGPANIILNTITRQMGKEYDDKGQLARGGVLQTQLLEKLNSLPYYYQTYPKSLGKEWVEENSIVFAPQNINHQDLLHTLVEHISVIIANELKAIKSGRVLITGGGAFNEYLIERIQEKTPLEIVIPRRDIIEMKEAIIFAFLGVLRMLNRPNVLHQVTGADSASISGALYDGR
jgi:anhydro-N-acetylmuramic acid kinase